MKEVTEEFMHEIDKNNMMAKEILKAMVLLLEEEDKTIEHNVLADSALEYLEQNAKLINSIL